jgi:hypothetical protein
MAPVRTVNWPDRLAVSLDMLRGPLPEIIQARGGLFKHARFSGD